MRYGQWKKLFANLDLPKGISHIERLPVHAQLTILRMPEVVERFYDQHQGAFEEECWLWRGGFEDYGEFSLGHLHIAAHRGSWIMRNGMPIPPGIVICHTCDVPACVNPSHLFAGTQSENMQDMLKKGYGRSRGRKNLLSLEQVIEIRQSQESVQDISLRLGAEYGRVYSARYGYSWSNLVDPAPWPRHSGFSF